MATTPRVWVLMDDRTGHSAQSLGLAQRLGLPYIIKRLHYSPLVKLPSWLIGSSRCGLTSASRRELKGPWPELVIAAGRRTIPVMRYIKKRSPQTKLVQLMWPHRLDPFDAIIAPSHDKTPFDPRILRTVGSLHALSYPALEQAAKHYAPAFEHLPRPYVAVLIGGSTRHGALKESDIQKLGDLAELLCGSGGSLLISTSRRSPKGTAELLKDRLTCAHHLFDWQSGGDNPYLGLLALSDAIIVTGDSISMCSEACYTGKAVFTFAPDHLLGSKHQSFIHHLHEQGFAAPLTPQSQLDFKPHDSLDEAGRIVRHLHELLAK